MRALWEQGFYGKGNLSRSEPNWLKREQVRRGLEESHVSEIFTVERREERIRAKWERARLEQELIRETREQEILQAELERVEATQKTAGLIQPLNALAPIGPLELLALPNSLSDLLARTLSNGTIGTPNGHLSDHLVVTDGLKHGYKANGAASAPSVSFAPSTRVIPGLHLIREQKASETATKPVGPLRPQVDDSEVTIVNKEHLQLMPEEALWLSFGMGALAVTDPATGEKLTSQELLTLFRQHCYFPPRTSPDDPELQPDDNFLIHYATYHYFRSLGWVPRGGIKFGVDWLLYTRGPAFDHAQFGLVVIPSYSDPWWREAGKSSPQMTWHWLHSIIRVLSHVMKSLVLVYVDVPPPPKFNEALEKGLTEALKLYRVREFPIKRWSANRNR